MLNEPINSDTAAEDTRRAGGAWKWWIAIILFLATVLTYLDRRIMANVLRPEDRGLGSGIFNSGAAVGSLIAPLVITPIAIHYGWRTAFLVIGAVGFLWIPLWLWTTRKMPVERVRVKKTPASRQQRLASVGRWFREVLLHPGFWMLLVIGVTVNHCWYFLNEWIPKYMHDQRGLSYLTAGLITIPIFLGADLGNLLSGALIKYLTSCGWSLRKARGATLTLAALLIAPAALLPLTDHTWVAVGILGLAALGITSFVANYIACQQDFSFANVGIVAGILGMSCNLIAAGLNPWIGRYVDVTGNYTLIFILIGTLPIVSLSAVLVFDAIIDREGET